jgi:ketosteroid isomerase-like protein
MTDRNVQTVQSIYAAFGRGDVPAILGLVADDTHWSFNAINRSVPWYEPVTSRATLPKFFQSLADNLDMHVFEPRRFFGSGDDVLSHVHIEYTVKQTGRRVVTEQIHWWTFNGEGRVARQLHFEDTAQVVAACGG